ncbi:hypothetical protein R6Q57_014427 [Mikania cordata]
MTGATKVSSADWSSGDNTNLSLEYKTDMIFEFLEEGEHSSGSSFNSGDSYDDGDFEEDENPAEPEEEDRSFWESQEQLLTVKIFKYDATVVYKFVGFNDI